MEAIAIGIEHSQQRKEEACKGCIRNSEILRGAYAGDNYVISRFISKEDLSLADNLSAQLKDGVIPELTYLGVDVGRIAAYEVLLKFKKTSLFFRGAELVYIRNYVRSSLLSLMAFSKIHQIVQPDVLVAYSPQYAVLGVCARYCELRGTQVYFIEGSSNIEERYKCLRIWDWSVFGLTNPALKYWENIDSQVILEEDCERIEKHFHRLLEASSFSVYSEPVSGQLQMRSYFGVPPGAKVILAAMSSYDEVYSAYVIKRFPPSKFISNVFPNQLEWIKGTINFVATHPELFLIIRIHPRTFPSKRNGVMALEQIKLAELFTFLPQNVKVNFPDDKISIYDLFSQIDALVTGWSATGMEAMHFSVPVVTYDRNLPSYPASIHFTGDSQTDYFKNLLMAVTVGKSKSVAEHVLRWMAFSMSVGVVSHPALLGDTYCVRYSLIGNFLYRIAKRLLPDFLKRLEARNRIRAKAEILRLNELLSTGQPSLYDIERFPKLN